MKKIVHYPLLFGFLLLLSCNREQEATRTGTEEYAAPASDAIPGESLEEVGLKPLGVGAERYLGKFVSQENSQYNIVLRKHPTREGMLAWNAYIGGKTPGSASFWYDDNRDQVSNRFAKVQPKFTVMKLNEAGDMLTEVTIDLDKNTSDTTLFMRMQ